jgi:hypothetical protein
VVGMDFGAKFLASLSIKFQVSIFFFLFMLLMLKPPKKTCKTDELRV